MSKKPYKTGYGKPPKGSRFAPGKSGNPLGRPKVSKTINSLSYKELNKKITIIENGQRLKITRGEAMTRKLVEKGLTGDIKAMELLFHQYSDHQSELLVDRREKSLSELDREIVSSFIKEYARKNGLKVEDADLEDGS